MNNAFWVKISGEQQERLKIIDALLKHPEVTCDQLDTDDSKKKFIKKAKKKLKKTSFCPLYNGYDLSPKLIYQKIMGVIPWTTTLNSMDLQYEKTLVLHEEPFTILELQSEELNSFMTLFLNIANLYNVDLIMKIRNTSEDIFIAKKIINHQLVVDIKEQNELIYKYLLCEDLYLPYSDANLDDVKELFSIIKTYDLSEITNKTMTGYNRKKNICGCTLPTYLLQVGSFFTIVSKEIERRKKWTNGNVKYI